MEGGKHSRVHATVASGQALPRVYGAQAAPGPGARRALGTTGSFNFAYEPSNGVAIDAASPNGLDLAPAPILEQGGREAGATRLALFSQRPALVLPS